MKKISHDLPSLARPIASLGLGTGVRTIVSGTERLPACRNVLLDAHVGVTETHNLDLASVLDVDG